MRAFDWEDGFTPYSATVSGDRKTLAEYQGDTVERVSRLAYRPEWNDHPNADDYRMIAGFSVGEVGGVPVAWIDGYACELLPSGDFDCCAYGTGHDVAEVTR